MLVGGSVRDFLLGRETPDLDLATSAKPSEMLAILRPLAEQLWMQGVKYGTIGALVHGQRVEITTYREEWYVEDSRKPEVRLTDIGWITVPP